MTEIEVNLSEMGMWGARVLEQRLERAEAEIARLRAEIERLTTERDAARRFAEGMTPYLLEGLAEYRITSKLNVSTLRNLRKRALEAR